MRKVALIEEQRRDREKEEILKSILDTMNAKRGQADLTKSEFAIRRESMRTPGPSGTSWA